MLREAVTLTAVPGTVLRRIAEYLGREDVLRLCRVSQGLFHALAEEVEKRKVEYRLDRCGFAGWRRRQWGPRTAFYIPVRRLVLRIAEGGEGWKEDVLESWYAMDDGADAYSPWPLLPDGLKSLDMAQEPGTGIASMAMVLRMLVTLPYRCPDLRELSVRVDASPEVSMKARMAICRLKELRSLTIVGMGDEPGFFPIEDVPRGLTEMTLGGMHDVGMGEVFRLIREMPGLRGLGLIDYPPGMTLVILRAISRAKLPRLRGLCLKERPLRPREDETMEEVDLEEDGVMARADFFLERFTFRGINARRVADVIGEVHLRFGERLVELRVEGGGVWMIPPGRVWPALRALRISGIREFILPIPHPNDVTSFPVLERIHVLGRSAITYAPSLAMPGLRDIPCALARTIPRLRWVHLPQMNWGDGFRLDMNRVLYLAVETTDFRNAHKLLFRLRRSSVQTIHFQTVTGRHGETLLRENIALYGLGKIGHIAFS